MVLLATVSTSVGYIVEVIDNLNTTQTPECTKDKYNVKIIK
jgi:hypothetical protein